MTWWQWLRAICHRHLWVLVIDPPDAPGTVRLQCFQCGKRSGGWPHGPHAI